MNNNIKVPIKIKVVRKMFEDGYKEKYKTVASLKSSIRNALENDTNLELVKDYLLYLKQYKEIKEQQQSSIKQTIQDLLNELGMV